MVYSNKSKLLLFLRKKWKLLVGLGFLALIFAGALAYNRLSPTDETAKNRSNGISRFVLDLMPTPTPVPFQELTIPYLRARTYESSLGELTKFSENQSYTSYTTFYYSDGLKVNGYLTVPKGEMPQAGWPGAVFVHGYIPPQEYKTTQNYVTYVDYLARRGLVVFKIDLRGHDQSEGEPGGAYYSADYIIDTLNAYSALEKTDFTDPKKIGLWGHSMGGNVVFRSFVAMPEIKKVVIWAGAVYTYEDFQDYRISDRSYQPPADQSERRRKRQELFDTYGDFSPENLFWSQVVPTNYLEGVGGAVQIHHALDDKVVNIGYSRNIVEILEGAGINSQLFEYPSGGHNITGASFDQAMNRSARFLAE